MMVGRFVCNLLFDKLLRVFCGRAVQGRFLKPMNAKRRASLELRGTIDGSISVCHDLSFCWSVEEFSGAWIARELSAWVVILVPKVV